LGGFVAVALQDCSEMEAFDSIDNGGVERASGKAETDETNLDRCFWHVGVSLGRVYILIPGGRRKKEGALRGLVQKRVWIVILSLPARSAVV
jgi:hypothetical protein